MTQPTQAPHPYAGISDPVQAGKLLDLMIDAASVNPKGFRTSPYGKHHKGRIIKKTAVERLAETAYGV